MHICLSFASLNSAYRFSTDNLRRRQYKTKVALGKSEMLKRTKDTGRGKYEKGCCW